MIRSSTTGYVTIKRFDLYGLKATPTGRLDNGRAEFIIIDKNPQQQGLVWLAQNEIC